MRLLPGDCRDIMAGLMFDGEQFDAIVTDPPYHLTSVVERFGKPGSAEAKSNGETGVYARASRGFMGKEWDGGDIAFRVETWQAAFELLKPGGHLVAFGGSRGYHRMAVAIEDAGFEIRDSLMWLYGTGFPKSHNLDGEWQGWGTALKPAFEPIVLARKPFKGTVAANVLTHGVGAINIDACRIEGVKPLMGERTETVVSASSMSGTSTGCKSTGEMTTEGRWPANVLHDGSEEVLEAFAAFGERKAGGSVSGNEPSAASVGRVTGKRSRVPSVSHADTGSAARFFYSAKAGASDRAGSKHPTVKPLALMRWLCTLVTPPGGRILDPFGGSGTTLQAAHECGFEATVIERDPEYQADIERRIMSLLLGE